MSDGTRVEHVTCLGCGCGCDDLAVTVSGGRISDVSPACPVSRSWFGDGVVPQEIRVGGRPVAMEQALDTAARLLLGSRGRVLVYLGLDLTSQAQRLAVALADLLGARVDSATSSTAAEGLLAVQRRGRAGATLGELRNRADVLLFWGLDPAERYPRFLARYVEPAGTQVPEGRKGRVLIGVAVGADPAPKGVDLTVTLAPAEEIATLSLMRATLQGHQQPASSPALARAAELTNRLTRARYAAVVHDAEPTGETRNPLRVEALVALVQALNGPTRAALFSLRSGGNRVGAEAVLTWQAGYPFSVDYGRGSPRYDPGDRAFERPDSGGIRSVLILGSPAAERLPTWLGEIDTVVIGPRASQTAVPAKVAVDTGVAGIHEAGTAYRTDEVPLRLRPPLERQRSAAEVVGALLEQITSGLKAGRP